MVTRLEEVRKIPAGPDTEAGRLVKDDVEQMGVTGQSLNALVLDEWIPFPPDSGKRVRTWNLLRRLALRHKVSLLCYGDPEGEAAHTVRSAGVDLRTVPPLRNLEGGRLYWSLLGNLFSRLPYSVSKHDTRRFREQLRRLVGRNHFDLVQFEWTPYARFADEIGCIPSLIMAHNIESQIWIRRAQNSRGLLEAAYFGLQARKMESFERRVMQRSGGVATVTELDAQQVKVWGVRDTMLVENGVDLDEFTPAAEEARDTHEILFLGSLDWYPNVDAVEYLVGEILPLVLVHVPEANLRIVGRRPPQSLRKRVAQVSAAELVGEVADVRPHIARAAVVVVPLRVGGGSRIKILEALAMGKAVVSTSIGAEGLAVSDSDHLLLADSPADFAERMVELLRSPGDRARLGHRGRKLVEERYSWDRAAEALESAWLRMGQPQAVLNNPPVRTRKEVQASP